MQIAKKWIAAVVIGLAASVSAAHAQNYPTRAITLVIPFAPGGSTSIVGRGIADKMSELLGEKIVVDNRPGAGAEAGRGRHCAHSQRDRRRRDVPLDPARGKFAVPCRPMGTAWWSLRSR